MKRSPRGAVLSIQSSVVAGHVGACAAEWPLMRLGFAPWRIATVRLSHHPGRGRPSGVAADASEIDDLVSGLERLGALSQTRALLTGYLGAAAQGDAILRARDKLRAHAPDAPWLLDPVIGDHPGGAYVAPAIAAFMKDAVAKADIVTPNLYELGILTEGAPQSLDDALEAARRLLARGPALVVVTSIPCAADSIGVLSVAADGAHLVETPRLAGRQNGAGDLLAASFLARLLRAGSAPDAAPRALEQAVSSVHAVIAETTRRGAPELALAEAQDALLTPPRRFAARRL